MPPRDDYPELLVVDPAHYVITKEIARGGMGRIHVARDRRLGREVAVKEILAGSGSLARRFEREVRITAQLQHPSIVSVHEAGVWPSGEPFYAMRLVQGRSLDEVIAGAKTFDERLALLPNVLAVADAMAYAHGRHVIHRDLKPRNVVIGEFGETVVVDWGLAKNLTQTDTLDSGAPGAQTALGSGSGSSAEGETTLGEVLGTPAYMPPEQAAGEPVDERADVYAIGAMLYHLLAGRAPYVAASNAALIAAVYAEPPRPLVELVPAAPSELVTIVERAMARIPAQRYPTARALAEDLRRFQTGQLVGAHRYSTRQLVRRWIARHRTAVVAFSTATLVVIGIGIVALRRVFAAEHVAEDQRSLAVANQKTAEELMQFMLDDLHPKLAHVGKLDLLDAVARRAASYYDSRGAISDDDTLLAAKAQVAIAQVMVSRGDLPSAMAELDKAKTKLDLLVASRPENVRYQVAAIDVRFAIGEVQASQGQLPAALASYREGLASAERLALSKPDAGELLHARFAGHTKAASVLADRGDLDGSLAGYQAALQVAVTHAEREQSSAVTSDLFNAHAMLGRVWWDRDNLDAGLREYRVALEIATREATRDPKDVIWLEHVATTHIDVGKILRTQKKLAEALTELRLGRDLFERLVKVDPSNTVTQTGRASSSEQVGIVLLEQHDVANALVEFQANHATWIELTARDPSNTDWQRQLSVSSNKIGDVQLATHDIAGALASYQAALAIRERLVARDPSKDKWRRDLFYSHIKLAAAYDTMGKQPQMIAELRTALAITQESVTRNPANPSSLDDLMQTHIKLGRALLDAHDRDSARAEYRAALAIATQEAAKVTGVSGWRNAIGQLTQWIAKLDSP